MMMVFFPSRPVRVAFHVVLDEPGSILVSPVSAFLGPDLHALSILDSLLYFLGSGIHKFRQEALLGQFGDWSAITSMVLYTSYTLSRRLAFRGSSPTFPLGSLARLSDQLRG